MIGDTRQVPKPFWKYITIQKGNPQGISPLKVNDNYYNMHLLIINLAESDVEDAEAFNSQFSNVSSRFGNDSDPYYQT